MAVNGSAYGSSNALNMRKLFIMRCWILSRVAISILSTAGLSIAGASQQAAQQPASDQPVATLHVQAREVLLPVTVRDKHGALVTNLQKSDFTLTEDGRIGKVTDVQGIVAIKPVLAERWTPAGAS